jgi:hypothetical protein
VLILLGFAAVASAGFVLLLAAAWWRAFRLRDRLPMDGVVWLSLAAVTGFVVTGKVLSPQYLLWLLPAAAAGLVVAGDAYPRLLRWCGVLLAATALTQLVFPTLYRGLVFEDASSGWAVLVLAVRNVLLVWLFVRACSEVRSVLRDAQRGRPLERQAPGPEGNEVRILR